MYQIFEKLHQKFGIHLSGIVSCFKHSSSNRYCEKILSFIKMYQEL